MAVAPAPPRPDAHPPTGRRLPRLEDPRLLTGRGCYVDDLEPHALHAAFVRSEHAHARVRDVDVTGALAVPGVAAVYTWEDLDGPLADPLPLISPHPGIVARRTQRALAHDEVCYAGETIAMVVARDRYVAEDAAAAIRVSYEPLPVIADLLAAAAPDAPTAHADMQDNLAAVLAGQTADVEAALAEAPHVFSWRFDVERSAAMPLEGRAVLARYDPAHDSLLVHDSTQVPTSVRRGLAHLLGMDLERVHVVAPDVGGAFGVKGMQYYAEEVLVPWAARRLGAAVKWTEDRREHFIASNQERRQVHDVRVGCDGDGRLLAFETRFLHDTGAYIPYGLIVPINTLSHVPGVYRVPAYGYEMRAIFTNTVCTSPYRGAGRPQAIFAMERTLDRLAGELGIDRAEIRRRNLVTPEEMPYDTGIVGEDGGHAVYDSGDFPHGLELALQRIGYDGWSRRRRAAARGGRRVGLGIACYVEGTGIGPFEGARVEVHGSGRVTVATGLSTQGQSHATVFAQVTAEQLGVAPDEVDVTTGDTRLIGYGVGTFASRAAVVAGSAVHEAAQAVREQALQLAARALAADPADVELADGAARVKGAADPGIPLGRLALLANPSHHAYDAESEAAQAQRHAVHPPGGPALRDGERPGLVAVSWFSPPATTWASGMHAAVVEVDAATMELRILDYVIVHDCGTVLNPLVVDGQVIGGFAQGIGGAFYERIAYDADGQIQNASFMDFLMPYATEVPLPQVVHMETASPLNPLGAKGAGEGGVMPVSAVIANAVADALDTPVDRMPLSPVALQELLAGLSRSGSPSRA
ncbi:MAG: aerobic carbon-monoxide dehydrogenase large subunit [Conexibacter sp.]